MPKNISHLVLMGDSLSDRGTLERRFLCNFVPMSVLSGLSENSPSGRFTNGYAWSDFISAILASEFIIKHLKKKYRFDATDIADAIIANDPRVINLIRQDYTLKNDRFVRFEGKDFVRNYDEGGLTAHDYKWIPSKSITRFFSRMILATLKEKRSLLLAYDRENKLSKKQKNETLVVEWSGANDLITVNERPSKKATDLAIKSRIENVEILIKNNYRNFVLFNLPDLSLTPFFQNQVGKKGQQERDNACDFVKYFNDSLLKECQKIQSIYLHCKVEIFDVNKLFSEHYNNPENYGFERDKLKKPYIESLDFIIRENATSPAKGYLFWDQIHPSADLHALLAKNFYDIYSCKYNFSEPGEINSPEKELDISSEKLCAAFRLKYEEELIKNRMQFFNLTKPLPETISLSGIFKIAFRENNSNALRVIKELQWVDDEGNLNLNVPALKKASEAVKFNRVELPLQGAKSDQSRRLLG